RSSDLHPRILRVLGHIRPFLIAGAIVTTRRAIHLVAAILLAACTWLGTAHAASAAPSIRPRSFQGVGDDVVRVAATKLRGIAILRHSGESNFAVWSATPSGRNSELLVNRIGDYSGTVVVNVYPWSTTAGFKIHADGPWTMKFAPISYAPLWKHSKVNSRGDKVLKLKAPTRGFRTLRYDHSGSSNFVVYAFPTSGSPALLVNKIGRVSGRVAIPAGTRYVSVQADGRWTLNRQ